VEEEQGPDGCGMPGWHFLGLGFYSGWPLEGFGGGRGSNIVIFIH
jgi:hypothetical protein